MSKEKHHIVPFKVHAIVLVALLIMTAVTILITHIELGPLTVTGALVIATIKATIVLTYFMHLKFDNRFYALMAIGVILVIGIVIFITFLDYLYR